MATHSGILAWRIPMDRGAWQAIVHEVSKSQINSAAKHSTQHTRPLLLKSKEGK